MQFLGYDVFSEEVGRTHATAPRGAVCLKRLCCLVVLCWLGVAGATAQLATIRGRVTDQADDQPLPGAAVVLRSLEEGNRMGTAADGNGYFVLARITPGRYVAEVSFLGYLPQVDTLDLAFGDHRTLDVHLQAQDAEMDELVVESGRESSAVGAAGYVTILPSSLARIPMPSVSPDLAAYLQTLPGVVTTGDRGGHLFIRGGTPTQNLVLIDGMPIFQPFHIVGFYSVFPADIVAYADVHAGGFGARYGGRISSVIDVATRNGNKQRVGGGASIAPFLGTARVELPIVPERVSVLASVRESVIERVSPDVLGQELPYRFGDRFLKLHAYLSRTSSLSLTTLHTNDVGDVADTEGQPNEIRWRNTAFGGHYIYLPDSYAAMAQIRFFISRLENRYRPFNAPEREASTGMYGVEAGFVYFLGNTEVRMSLFGQSYSFEYDLGGTLRPVSEFITEGGLYADLTIRLNRQFRLEPGLRMHSFPSRSQLTLEPRLRAVWQPRGESSRHIFSMAWGLYHQQIIGLYNARDVTDAFVTWASSPEGSGNVPQAMHVLAGWRGQVWPWMSLSLEGYYKAMSHLVFAEYSEALDAGIVVDPVEGRAQGIDVKMEVTRPWFYGELSYGLASVQYERQREQPVFRDGERGQFVSERQTVTERFSPPHDRRHQVNALFRLARGPYAAGVRWQFGSGLPYTAAAGFYDSVPIPRPDDTGYRTRPGQPVLVNGRTLYSERLPTYHRLDVSVERWFKLGNVQVTLQAAVINIYDRANIFDYDLFAGRRVNQLPLIPSMGVKVEVL